VNETERELWVARAVTSRVIGPFDLLFLLLILFVNTSMKQYNGV